MREFSFPVRNQHWRALELKGPLLSPSKRCANGWQLAEQSVRQASCRRRPDGVQRLLSTFVHGSTLGKLWGMYRGERAPCRFTNQCTAHGRVPGPGIMPMTQVWADDSERRREARGSPSGPQQLARLMLERAVESGVVHFRYTVKCTAVTATCGGGWSEREYPTSVAPNSRGTRAMGPDVKGPRQVRAGPTGVWAAPTGCGSVLPRTWSTTTPWCPAPEGAAYLPGTRSIARPPHPGPAGRPWK